MVKRTLIAATALILGLMAVGWIVIWRSPPFYTGYEPQDFPVPIMTMAEYGELLGEHSRPYIVTIDKDNGGGALVLFGAEHSMAPDHPQLSEIERRWMDLDPTVALVEGRLGFLIPGLMDPVKTFGEMGAVGALAKRSGVVLYSWEPSRETEVALMLRNFPPERVALFYVLRPYFSDLRHGKPDDPDTWVEPYLRRRTRWPGLENTISGIEDIDRIWQRDFAEHVDWRDTSDAYGLPGYLSGMSDRSNTIRGEHLANILVNLVNNGERVFAITGSSHAVKLEGALRSVL